VLHLISQSLLRDVQGKIAPVFAFWQNYFSLKDGNQDSETLPRLAKAGRRPAALEDTTGQREQ
jgi:hypothetical protein